MEKIQPHSRGYLVTSTAQVSTPTVLQNWSVFRLGDYTVRHHPLLEATVERGEEAQVCLLGIVVDPIANIADREKIIETLHTCLTSSKQEFFEALDSLSGRFIIVANDTTGTIALQDAAGTKSLYYDDNPESNVVAASSPGVIAECGRYSRSEIADQVINSDVAYFPGLSTPYQGIRRLTPNTFLSFSERCVDRFYPRENISPQPLSDELVREITDILTTQIKLLNQNYTLSLSLSAGLDSRVSLASTRPVADQIDYLSWRSPGRKNTEADIAAELCRQLELRHRTISLAESPPVWFVDTFERHTSNMSTRGRAEGTFNFYKKFPKNTIELRSNVAEVGRAFYRNEIRNPPNTFRPENFSKLYFRVNSAEVDRTFEEFFATTGFTRDNTYNYDPYDLFYWEHRMGSWLAQWMLDKDLSHDNFVVFNNRRLLEKLLCVDIDRRATDELFYRIINNAWPSCLELPINPHKNKPTKKFIKRTAKGVAFRAPSPIYNRAVDLFRAL